MNPYLRLIHTIWRYVDILLFVAFFATYAKIDYGEEMDIYHAHW